MDVQRGYHPLPEVVGECPKDAHPEGRGSFLSGQVHHRETAYPTPKAQEKSRSQKRTRKDTSEGNTEEGNTQGFPPPKEEEPKKRHHIGKAELRAWKGNWRGKETFNNVENRSKPRKETDRYNGIKFSNALSPPPTHILQSAAPPQEPPAS